MVHRQNPFLLVCQYIINAPKEINVLQQITNLFRIYENIGALDPVSKNHLFALHCVYLPLINGTLEQFM